MGFKKLTNEQWSKIQPYLSKRADVGRPRANNRTTINGMIHVASIDCAWMYMPEQYGSKSTVHRRFQDMQEKGIWEMLLKSIIRLAYRQKKFNVKKIAIDSITIPGKKGDEKIGYDENKKILGRKSML